jgi:acylphosphatase
MPARRIRITGTVQGVFFRSRAKEKADELGLAGWVRNTEDGAVEMHVEGAAEALRQFEGWCKKGPPGARVASVASGEAAMEGHTICEIRY